MHCPKTERQKNRKTEKQKDRKTERQKNRERKRHNTDRETKRREEKINKLHKAIVFFLFCNSLIIPFYFFPKYLT
jgi:hypothetical protein